MANCADYLIYAVRYASKNFIEEVKAYRVAGGNLTFSEEFLRDSVLRNIKFGYTFQTIYVKSNGKFTQGEDVGIVRVHSEEFIRTDGKKRSADKLGKLPEF